MTQWRLPKRLREISGLALTSDERLLAIEDEKAIIYELDYDDGHIVKAFALGKPTLRGDFEGIAVAGDYAYLARSDGFILRFKEGEDGERVPYERFDTGLSGECEFEGLEATADGRHLMLLCKERKKKASVKSLALFLIDARSLAVEKNQTVLLDEAAILNHLRLSRIKPSGLARHPATGTLIIVAARQMALIEVTPLGELKDARILPLATRHRQSEGIAITTDGRLLLADEGGSKKARLAVYRQAATEKE